jgi:hypothetical protein
MIVSKSKLELSILIFLIAGKKKALKNYFFLIKKTIAH